MVNWTEFILKWTTCDVIREQFTSKRKIAYRLAKKYRQIRNDKMHALNAITQTTRLMTTRKAITATGPQLMLRFIVEKTPLEVPTIFRQQLPRNQEVGSKNDGRENTNLWVCTTLFCSSICGWHDMDQSLTYTPGLLAKTSVEKGSRVEVIREHSGQGPEDESRNQDEGPGTASIEDTGGTYARAGTSQALPVVEHSGGYNIRYAVTGLAKNEGSEVIGSSGLKSRRLRSFFLNINARQKLQENLRFGYPTRTRWAVMLVDTNTTLPSAASPHEPHDLRSTNDRSPDPYKTTQENRLHQDQTSASNEQPYAKTYISVDRHETPPPESSQEAQNAYETTPWPS
ncbi:hypothetical protein P692DRAFT_201807076 [Suillus brevipes Sb2]|nr:hypothetical protein P692DRAFT_201807076 [Suillus brevipes Sb2]